MRVRRVPANGVEFYTETRGEGPAVLLVPGATGDAGHFTRVADALADEFTVVTYDRRGNSRTRRPASWRKTSADQQADDADILLDNLHLAPAAVAGFRGGAIIALNMALRYPGSVRAGVVVEPPLAVGMGEDVLASLRAVVDEAVASGGHAGAVEAFFRRVVGDEVWDGLDLDPDLAERMKGNGEVLFDIEFGALESWQPDEAALSALDRPVHVLASPDSPAFLRQASQWVAERLGAEVGELPGGPAALFSAPGEVAEALRPLLRDAAGATGG